jgi:imidazolonepropionase-like amidohydrolase
MGTEIDRGSLINIGCFVGAPSILAFDIGDENIARCLKGDMDEDEILQKVCRSRIAARTIPLLIGIKDHHSHMVLSQRNMKRIAKLAYDSKVLFMSHAQCPDYAEDMIRNTEDYPVHFGHTDASACGSHGESVESFSRLLKLIRENERVTGEFTSTLLRPGLGDRDGIRVTKKSQELAFEALKDKVVDIIVSDGPSHAVKGFGDTKDSIPLLVELIENNILNPLDAVATMTVNPAKLMSKVTGQDWWIKEIGSLMVGSRADIAIVNPLEKEVVYTFVNGKMVAFEGRPIPTSYGSGGLITKYGILSKVGLADNNRFKIYK